MESPSFSRSLDAVIEPFSFVTISTRDSSCLYSQVLIEWFKCWPKNRRLEKEHPRQNKNAFGSQVTVDSRRIGFLESTAASFHSWCDTKN
jgi:hypothetical protein